MFIQKLRSNKEKDPQTIFLIKNMITKKSEFELFSIKTDEIFPMLFVGFVTKMKGIIENKKF